MTVIVRSSRQDEIEMLPEYDFSGQEGVRGKYYRAYTRGNGSAFVSASWSSPFTEPNNVGRDR